ncbi:hypothetical protein [Streptacidiphilus monticola]|jgi:hypothetical protein|uniref:Uncharacterized protein n=1 Tax=Streptacidiphilus monticola TaxID=2161674 RepID=A0ABW1GBW0_9ACTN
MKLLDRLRHHHPDTQAPPLPSRADVVDSEGGSFVHERGVAFVEVEPLAADSRYRVLHLAGYGTTPVAREEFLPTIRRSFPGIDIDDPDQVHWADHPWEWPSWHPGQA